MLPRGVGLARIPSDGAEKSGSSREYTWRTYATLCRPLLRRRMLGEWITREVSALVVIFIFKAIVIGMRSADIHNTLQDLIALQVKHVIYAMVVRYGRNLASILVQCSFVIETATLINAALFASVCTNAS
jgi:hypothetical protein